MTIFSPSALITTSPVSGGLAPGGPPGGIGPTNFANIVTSLAGIALSSQSASYTLTATDIGTVLEVNVTAPATAIVFVPTNASVPFDTGATFEVYQAGTGQVGVQAVTPGTTTLFSSTGTYTTWAQGSSIGLRKRATDTWDVSGERSPSVFVPIQGNYLTSQDPSNAFWTVSGITATTPDVMKETAVTAVHTLTTTSNPSRSAGTHPYCLFADFTPVTRQWVRLTVWDGSFADEINCFFNVGACAAGSPNLVTWTAGTAAVLPMGGSKVRCLLYFTTDASTTNFAVQVGFSTDGSTTSYLGVTADGFNMDNIFLYNTSAGAGGF